MSSESVLLFEGVDLDILMRVRHERDEDGLDEQRERAAV